MEQKETNSSTNEKCFYKKKAVSNILKTIDWVCLESRAKCLQLTPPMNRLFPLPKVLFEKIGSRFFLFFFLPES